MFTCDEIIITTRQHLHMFLTVFREDGERNIQSITQRKMSYLSRNITFGNDSDNSITHKGMCSTDIASKTLGNTENESFSK